MDGARKTGRVTILGCGGSGGVPLIGNYWGASDPNDPKNRRSRAALHLNIDDVSIAIDTGPDFRDQINRENIDRIDCVLYTHAHSDHINGIDDLRYMSLVTKEIIPVFGMNITLAEIAQRFNYLFSLENPLYQPRLLARPYKDAQIGARVHHIFEQGEAGQTKEFYATPFYQKHGAITSLGYRFGDFAYSTDVSDLDEDAFEVLSGIKTWVVDCGQFGQDFVEVHPNFDIVKKWNERVGAERVILTHMTVKADYQTLCDELPAGYEPAYDGLSFDIDL